jgi:hypothetical protein
VPEEEEIEKLYEGLEELKSYSVRDAADRLEVRPAYNLGEAVVDTLVTIEDLLWGL